MINVLICDDSALMRRVLKKSIEADPHINVIGTARDGEDAIVKARELKPDVITMDVNMPNVDGITALQLLVEDEIAPVIMVSSLTQRGAEITFEALELGAYDFIGKPDGTVSANLGNIENELRRKIKSAGRMKTLSHLHRKPQERNKSGPESGKNREIISLKRKKNTLKFGYFAVAIGISTGGPKTIFEVLPFLPEDLAAAVFLVQHMPANFTPHFAKRINDNSPLRCVEAEAGMVVEPGTIYLGRGGHHLNLFQKSNGDILIRTPMRPKHLFIPSVDVMMESVLKLFGEDTIGVLMTGMGDDGAQGMVNILNTGGFTIAESEESAIVFGMPAEAISRGGAELVLPSWDIAEALIKYTKTNGKVLV